MSEESNVISLFWWKNQRPKKAKPKTTEQKIKEALKKWGSHKQD